MQLTSVLKAWGTPAFESILKQEIEHMDVDLLPLQRGLSQSSYTSGAKRSVSVISARAEAGVLHIKTGIFYTGVIAGCSCADDPTPMSELPEYCEVQFDIDTITAETTVTLLAECA